MRDVKILVDTGMLARALFEAELYAEAEGLSEHRVDRTKAVLDVMWEKTKPEVRQRAEEQAVALMSFLGTYEGCLHNQEPCGEPPNARFVAEFISLSRLAGVPDWLPEPRQKP